MKKLTTSRGTPASYKMSTKIAAIVGESLDGFTTTVFPVTMAASAAAADATSCCCGRDTSLARIAASTVIFIAGITASWPSLARPAHDGGPAARPLMVMIEIRWTVAERPRRPWRGAARTVAEHPRRP